MYVISHVWPGYTLLNIFDLPYRQWGMLRAHADHYAKEARKNG